MYYKRYTQGLGYLYPALGMCLLVFTNQIIFKWTGADNIWSGSRGDNIDARKLYALEQFIGRGYKGLDNTNRPNRNAAVFLNTAYQTLLNNICASLRSQTDLKEAFDNLEIEIDNETNTCRYNLAKVQEYIDNKLSEDEQTGKTNNIISIDFWNMKYNNNLNLNVV